MWVQMENINLDKKVIYIRKARVVAKRQVLTKAPKTKNSIRTLAMSEYLISALKNIGKCKIKIKKSLVIGIL